MVDEWSGDSISPETVKELSVAGLPDDYDYDAEHSLIQQANQFIARGPCLDYEI